MSEEEPAEALSALISSAADLGFNITDLHHDGEDNLVAFTCSNSMPYIEAVQNIELSSDEAVLVEDKQQTIVESLLRGAGTLVLYLIVGMYASVAYLLGFLVLISFILWDASIQVSSPMSLYLFRACVALGYITAFYIFLKKDK